MRLEESGLVNDLNKTYGYPTVVLFGSYVRGEAVEGSDVDIAVISESKASARTDKFEGYLKRSVQLFVFSKLELVKLKKLNPSLYSGVINGIVISGQLDV